MSEKRYSVRFSEKWGRHMIHDNGEPIDNVPVMDLLNTQSEQIEFLRSSIIDYDVIHCREKKIVEQANHWPTERVELAKRRIAALEGK